MLYKIKSFLRSQIIDLRSQRKSSFIFISKNLAFSNLIILLKEEMLGNFRASDDLLIFLVIQDLVDKKILNPAPVDYSFFEFENLTYHDVFLKTTDNAVFCRGTSIDKSEAYAKALGEVFERTSLRFPAKDQKLEYKNQLEIKNDNRYISFDKFPKPTNLQLQIFPEFNINENDKFLFSEVENLQGEKFYLPTQFVYFGNFREGIEKSIIQPSTHGGAAGFSSESTFKSGFFEILHRHEYLKKWYGHVSPDKINLKSIPTGTSLSNKIKDFTNKNFQINFLDFTVEAGIPTIICILEKQGGWYCGGSTNFKKEYACERSLDEAFSTFLWSMKTLNQGCYKTSLLDLKNIKPGFIDEKATDANKVLWFSDSYFIDNFDKFILSGKEINFLKNSEKEYADKSLNLKNFANQKFGPDIFSFEVKSKLLSEYDYTVFKTIVLNSYFFALAEKYSRPVLSSNFKNPDSISINPFP